MLRTRVTITAPWTYFEATGWNAGKAGGGYLGIQDASSGGGSRCGTLSSGRNYIFSLWDPPSGSNGQAFVVYSNPSGSACHGTGEGGTAGYLNYAMPWQLGAWYRLVVRAWNYNSSTYFGFWSLDENASVWTHHATLGYPAPGILMTAGEGAFLEYFGPSDDPSANATRRAEYNDNWLRSPAGAWIPLGRARFTVSAGDGQSAFDAGVQDGAYYMQAGGDTDPASRPGAYLSIPSASADANTNVAPAIPVGRILSASASYDGAANRIIVSWTSDPAASPQFAYQVDLFDNRFFSGHPILSQSDIAPDARSTVMSVPPLSAGGYYVRLATTDLFDQTARPVQLRVSQSGDGSPGGPVQPDSGAALDAIDFVSREAFVP